MFSDALFLTLPLIFILLLTLDISSSPFACRLSPFAFFLLPLRDIKLLRVIRRFYSTNQRVSYFSIITLTENFEFSQTELSRKLALVYVRSKLSLFKMSNIYGLTITL